MPERRNVGTVREVVSWARADGLPISEYGLRLLIRQGRIPVRRIGAKALVFYPNVREYVTCANGQDNIQLGGAAYGS